MDCSTCKSRTEEENKAKEPVSWFVHEQDMARVERSNKRWFAAWLITFLVLVGGIFWYFWHEAQYVDESWTYEATADEISNAVINGEGEVYIYGGESESNAHEENP